GRGGRLELLERHGAKLHMGPAQIERADIWFQRYGQPTVLFGRMVPLIRAFVSLPAGVAKMPFWRFTVLSLIGATPWVLALALIGHAVGGDWTSVRNGFEYVDYVVVALIVAGIGYGILRRRRKSREPIVDPAPSTRDPGSSTL
ncbi:MAG TPA: DedA family protein, partial [Solirubrobacteraceae bacterium]